MKKIVAITMAAIMGIGLFSLVGCGEKIGNGNLYDPANFKEKLFFSLDSTIDEIERKCSVKYLEDASGDLVQSSVKYNNETYFVWWLRSNKTIKAVHFIGGDYTVMTKRIKQFAKYEKPISKFDYDVYRHNASNSHIIVVKFAGYSYCEFIICKIGDGEKILRAMDEVNKSQAQRHNYSWDKERAYWGE